MKVTWNELAIPGLLMSGAESVHDDRGSFTKVLSGEDPLLGSFVPREVFWTQSSLGVLRGMHFQLPPEATRKLVFVVSGSVRDFILDLRAGSPTEGRLLEVELTPLSGAMLIPAGCAHAYEAVSDQTIVCYAQDVPLGRADLYSGIRADSAGIKPRAAQPIISAKDLRLPTLDEFISPFIFQGATGEPPNHLQG